MIKENNSSFICLLFGLHSIILGTGNLSDIINNLRVVVLPSKSSTHNYVCVNLIECMKICSVYMYIFLVDARMARS